MKSLFSAHIHNCRMAALALVLPAVGLTGCSDAPHDQVEAPVPAKITTLPMPKKIAPDKPVAATVPAPGESEFGMPIYPGAKTYIDAGGMPVKPLTEGSMATAILETSDSLDKVLDYYKERIKATDKRGNATPSSPREEKENDRRKVILTGNDTQGNMQIAQIREETGKTVIELMRTSVKSLPSGVSDGK